eukprot:10809107-Lingulodinium_polyedra.AAC.1
MGDSQKCPTPPGPTITLKSVAFWLKVGSRRPFARAAPPAVCTIRPRSKTPRLGLRPGQLRRRLRR